MDTSIFKKEKAVIYSREWQRAWQRAHPEGRQATNKKYAATVPAAKWAEYGRRSKYGISPAKFEEMFEAQGHKCKICRSEIFRTAKEHGKAHVAQVDHDHKTNVVRGLLCLCCNTGLGRFKDDPELLRESAAYLEEGSND